VWHPGRSATLRLGPKTVVAAFGELHPRLVKEHDVPGGCVAAEIYLDAIPSSRGSGHARAAYSPPALQAISRDFAFVMPAEMTAEKLVRAVAGADKQFIRGVRVFDRYQPEGGELSLALEVSIQPAEKSFTEEEIAAISKRIVEAAEKLGARLRT
jgi:phenylalanyl-tRNA synthetase beta chain